MTRSPNASVRRPATGTCGGQILPDGPRAGRLAQTVAFQRDPLAFPEPDRFLPQRWLDAPDATAYLPFGGGARRCVGEPFAHALIETALPLLARGARLQPVGRGPERMVVRGTVTAGRRSVLARRLTRDGAPHGPAEPAPVSATAPRSTLASRHFSDRFRGAALGTCESSATRPSPRRARRI